MRRPRLWLYIAVGAARIIWSGFTLLVLRPRLPAPPGKPGGPAER